MMGNRSSINTPVLDAARNEALARIEAAMGFVFTDRSRLLTAVSHRSYVHQHNESPAATSPLKDNQRYEFLGDAVISLCISTLLYRAFPDKKEGQLSRLRAGLVNETQLADLARSIHLPAALLLGRGEETTGGRQKNSILADALEALVAAIYLDVGYEGVFVVVEKLWGPLLAKSGRADLLKDFKTQLQEKVQHRLGQTPEYRLVCSNGPDHARVFQVTLWLEGKEISSGSGRSKKEAEQNAAAKALQCLTEEGEPG